METYDTRIKNLEKSKIALEYIQRFSVEYPIILDIYKEKLEQSPEKFHEIYEGIKIFRKEINDKFVKIKDEDVAVSLASQLELILPEFETLDKLLKIENPTYPDLIASVAVPSLAMIQATFKTVKGFAEQYSD